MKIFQTMIRKIFRGGGSGVTLSHGVESQSDSLSLQTTLSHGAESQIDDFSPELVLPQGLQSQADSVTLSGEIAFPQGGESQRDALVLAATRDHGSEAASMTVSADLELSSHTATARAITPNDPAWQNVTEAEGAFDDVPAVATNPPNLNTSQDATLRCDGLAVPVTPDGFARSAIGVRVRHQFDLAITGAVANVMNVIAEIMLRDSAGAQIERLSLRLAASGAGVQPTLFNEDFDITGLVTEQQLSAGLIVDCRIFTSGVFVAAVNGNYSWQVDGVHLFGTYQRSGIQ